MLQSHLWSDREQATFECLPPCNVCMRPKSLPALLRPRILYFRRKVLGRSLAGFFILMQRETMRFDHLVAFDITQLKAMSLVTAEFVLIQDLSLGGVHLR